jgi:hypothetical protein
MTDQRGTDDPLAALSQRVDYLQGNWAPVDDIASAQQFTSAPPQSRRLSRIVGIGSLDKGLPSRPDSRPRWESEQRGQREAWWLPRSTDLLVGLHGRTALVYAVLHLDGQLLIKAGVWSSRPDARDLDVRQETLLALMRSCYLEVTAEPTEASFGDATHGGYVLGVPNPRTPGAEDPASPWDRLLRGLHGERWAAIILAQPIQESARVQLREQLLSDSRTVRAVLDKDRPQHPLAEAYLESLKLEIETLTLAGAIGAWRTAVYLLGDHSGYARLSAAWRGLFAGANARGLPVRVHSSPAVLELAREWAMPDISAPQSPGAFQFPFAAQTVLSSDQVASYLHLPEQEHPGFSVEQVVVFDSNTKSSPQAGALELGKVLDGTRLTNESYWITPQSLNQHAFVCGVTGAGKTNTILVLLAAAREHGAQFLVLEPAKTEYRSLLTLPELREELRVFTAGDETVSPLRLNPLEVPAGKSPDGEIAVATHLDLVRALFSAAFALWDPIPQILERALHRSYADRGWDVTANRNDRLDATADRRSAFPTLSDLSDHADEVIRESGYDPEAMGRIRGALGAALGGLRAGGKGRMFDTNSSIDSKTLFERPVVIEMEALGDEADKAFLMGLILIRLTEHRRMQGEHDGLRHLLVVEEAHRLLSNKAKAGSSEKSGDPGGKAIETFTNLLAEVRAYGQGLVIADQVPSRLAPEVLKNTNLKIVHRIVAEDDRKAMGETMVMTDVQSRALATFNKKGRAAVFAEGEDSPVLIDVKPLKSRLAPVSLQELRESAPSWSASEKTAETCCGAQDAAVCERGREAATNTRFRSLIAQIAVTLATNPDAAPHLGRDLRIELEAALPSAHDEEEANPAGRCTLWHSADYLARRRGAQRGWTYSEMREHTTSLDTALVAVTQGPDQDTASAAHHYRDLAQRLYARRSDPFPSCGEICPQPTCLYRWPAADALADPTLGDPLRTAAAPVDGNADSALHAADMFARWLTTLPKDDWNQTETELARKAANAAALCALQLAVVESRPDPSSSAKIRSLLGAGTS